MCTAFNSAVISAMGPPVSVKQHQEISKIKDQQQTFGLDSCSEKKIVSQIAWR